MANAARPAARHRSATAVRRAGRRLRGAAPWWWWLPPGRRLAQGAALLLFGCLFALAYGPGGVARAPGGLASEPAAHLAAPGLWPVEAFLWLDPLVGLAASLAARAWSVALWGTALWALVSLVLPRGFCSYVCPLGTLIDAADWLAARTVRRRLGESRGERPVSTRWRAARFAVLAAVLGAALAGVQAAGHLAALPLLTRGLVASLGRWQAAARQGWEAAAGTPWPVAAAAGALLAAPLLLALAGRRFWCRTVCPTGALLSVLAALRLVERRVDLADCARCGRCPATCDFGAVAPDDFSTRHSACTSCRDCAAACPTNAVRFTARQSAAPEPAKTVWGPSITRRQALWGAGAALAGAAVARAAAATGAYSPTLLRPPGAVGSERFQDLCVRCGECIRVCPSGILRMQGLEAGIEGLWMPVADPARGGCLPECNRCTQACPTGAIGALALDEKRRYRMGRARVDRRTCLAHTGRHECGLCFEECGAAGYGAIEMRAIQLAGADQVPEGLFSDDEIAAMGRALAPFVVAERCVGCGLCEHRCHAVNVRGKGELRRSAIRVAPLDEGQRPPAAFR